MPPKRKTSILIFAVPVTLEQAIDLYEKFYDHQEDIFYKKPYKMSGEFDLMLFTDNKKSYSKISHILDTEYDSQHYFGIEIQEDTNQPTPEKEVIDVFNFFSIPLLKEVGVIDMKPDLFVITQI